MRRSQAGLPQRGLSCGRRYFGEASRDIGVHETNDFIYGALHTALRKQLDDGLNTAGNATGFALAALPEHPAVRYLEPWETLLTPQPFAIGWACRQPTRRPWQSSGSFSNSKRRLRSSRQPFLVSFEKTNSAPYPELSVRRGLPAGRPTVSGQRQMHANGSW